MIMVTTQNLERLLSLRLAGRKFEVIPFDGKPFAQVMVEIEPGVMNGALIDLTSVYVAGEQIHQLCAALA